MKKPLHIAFLITVTILIVTLLLPLSVQADTVVATIAVGDGPFAVAANPATHRIYVANYNTTTLSVIDSVTDTVVATIDISAGNLYPYPVAVAVNPNTNKIYVVNFWGGQLVVINGQTNQVETSISVGTSHANPRAVVVNSQTNKVYVTNLGRSVVYAIDGNTNQIEATIPVGSYPRSAAINSTLGLLYVANLESDSVSVINVNPASSTYNQPIATVGVGDEPYAIGVNTSTGKLYVANRLSNNVSVIDSNNQVEATVSVGNYPRALGINTETNKVYVVNKNDNTVSIIDGATNAVSKTIAVGANPYAVATVNTIEGNTYVTNSGSNTVTVIDPAGNTQELAVGNQPLSLAIDGLFAKPKVYVANFADDAVSVIDPPIPGTTSLISYIDPLLDDSTTLPTPRLTGRSENNRAPYNSNIMKVLYQVDGLEGEWAEATIISGAGTPSVSWEANISVPLEYGTHTIYAVGLDMTAATISSTNGNISNSMSTGTITSYTFQVSQKMYVNDVNLIYAGKVGYRGHRFEGLEFTVHIKDVMGGDISEALVDGELTVPTGETVPYSGLTGLDGKVTFGYWQPKTLPLGTYTFTVINVKKEGAVYDPSLNVEISDEYVHPKEKRPFLKSKLLMSPSSKNKWRQALA